MARKQKIIVEITAAAATTVTVEGCKGASCEKLTADLEKALGSREANRRTAEFYERPLHTEVKQ